MIYHFFNMAEVPICSVDESTVISANPHEPEYSTHAAIQWLFSGDGWPSMPSTASMVLVRSILSYDEEIEDEYTLEHWSVGPFDLLIRKEFTLEPVAMRGGKDNV